MKCFLQYHLFLRCVKLTIELGNVRGALLYKASLMVVLLRNIGITYLWLMSSM